MRMLCGALIVLIASLGLVGMRAAGYEINLSASMPRGLYRVTHDPLAVGQLVAICLPHPIAQFGRERGYLTAGACAESQQPVLKRIAAMAGDRIEVQPDAVTINGTRVPNSAVSEQDSHGRVLPHVPWGTYTLKRGELWVMSTYVANSWDSRYYGPVPVSSVYATARPVIVVTAGVQE
jgi:conjugative transfer signal peptidase TraF